jgi:hypothetical protein
VGGLAVRIAERATSEMSAHEPPRMMRPWRANPDTIRSPSGENVAHMTASGCWFRQRRSCPVVASQMRTVSSCAAVQMRLAFEDLDRSIDGMVAVANGDDAIALIFSAKDAALRTLRAVEGIRELTEDGPKKERLQRLLDQLKNGGRRPEPRGS